GAFIFFYIVYSVATKGLLGALNMNLVIFLFVGINCFLFPEPHQWIEAHKNSMHLATDVMLQFPFYGAIMGMMYLTAAWAPCSSTPWSLWPTPRPCPFS
ncbi:TIGR00366 family protein, partial [Intestinimonas massiliensis]|uniref:TIGR00366 family protein n=1 Tax=Intestinimonas massiliensis (ex Afouda et al. 2020) TaxID=1673721 RepID=UPI0021090BA0